ncbi:unnamed protein product [Closterium sp. NIES-53]
MRADLVTHLRTSDARYRAALPAEFLARAPPTMYITLYFIVTRLPDSLRAVIDHFLTLDPTDLTVDLLEQPLLAAETSVVTVGAARGTPRTPFFEGMSELLLLVGSAAAARARVAGVVEAPAGVVVGAVGDVVEVVEVVAAVGVVVGVRALVAVVVAAVGVAVVAAVGVVAVGVELFRGAVMAVASSSCNNVGARPSPPSSFVSGLLSMGRLGVVVAARLDRCFSRLDDAWRAEFGDEAERTRWAELLSAERDCYLCVPPDPSIEAGALGASESALPGTAPTEALNTFTLDSVLARSSTLLPCPVVPSGSLSGLHLPSFSTNLVSTAALQDGMVTTTTSGGQRVSICMCIRTGRHLATFTRRPGSSLYTLTTEPPQVAASAQVSASGQVSASPLALACPALSLLRRGAAARRSSLVLISPNDCSPADSPHGRVGLSRRPWTGLRALISAAPHWLSHGGAGAGAAGGTGARAAGGTGAAGPVGARTGGTGAAGAGGAAGVGAWDSRAGDTGAGGTDPGGAGAVGAGSGDTGRPQPYFVPLLQQVLGLPSSPGLTPPLLCPPPDQSQPPLQPASPLPAPSPYTEQTGGLTEGREPASRPASPVRVVRTGRRVPRPRPPPVPGTHHMAIRPSSVPQRVPLPSPPSSSLADGLDPDSFLLHAASPIVPRLLATVVTGPSFESAAVSALVAELVDFAAACRLDYVASLVAESGSDCPPSVGGECALGTDVLEDRQEDFEHPDPALLCLVHPGLPRVQAAWPRDEVQQL